MKIITFYEFKYHLSPYEEKDPTFEFDGPKPDRQQLINNKNNIFSSILESLVTSKTDKNLFKLIDKEDDIYLFKISNKKNTKIIQNFEIKEIPTDPYVYLIVDNTSSTQKIYISENPAVFKTINATKNVLVKVFKRHLNLQYLNIEVTEVFDKKDFWDLVQNNEYKINYINVEIIKPNPSDHSKNLYDAFQNFAGKANAYKSNILLKAPDKGILKNINKQNKDLLNLVEHSSESGGDIKIKIIGTRKQFSTSNSVKKVDMEEKYLEHIEQQLFKQYIKIIHEHVNKLRRYSPRTFI